MVSELQVHLLLGNFCLVLAGYVPLKCQYSICHILGYFSKLIQGCRMFSIVPVG